MNDRNIEIDYNTESWNIVNNNGYFNIFNNFTNQFGLSISPEGNVGIRSSNPKSTLDITGAVNILGIARISSNVQFGTNDNIVNNIYIYSGIESTRLGIGTKEPIAPLDIIGNANISGLITVGSVSIKSETSIIPIAQIGTNIDETSNLYFIGGGTSRIGIGKKSPNDALDIIGDVNITGIYKINNRNIIQDTSNYVESTCNILIGLINDTSNYVGITSNILIGRISDTSNYIETTSNVLAGHISDTSNYIEITSNVLAGRISDTSNYIETTSNVLAGRISDTSNYVEITSNVLACRISDTSNYVETTSNVLAYLINDTSNYVGITSNILAYRISDTSNYIETTSNILVSRISDTSNYVETTSNIISKNLSLLDSKIKCLSLKLNLNSNILIGRINDTSNYVASTCNILIGSINDTSNYVASTSNILVGSINDTSNYVASTCNILIGSINDTSNYVASTCNILIGSINDTSNYVASTCNILIDLISTTNGNINDSNTSNYVASTCNILIDLISTTNGNINDSNTSNYVLSTCNILIDLISTNSNIKTNIIDASVLHKYCPIQAHFNIYKRTEAKTKPGWQFVDEDIDNKILNNYNNENSDTIDGFCIRIKPNYTNSKILINLNCHVGIDDGLNVGPGENIGVNARPWGFRLYRKIGFDGDWEHVTGADADSLVIPGITGTPLTKCWVSHNLGAGSEKSSIGIANITGTYYDDALVSDNYIYYTAKWCSILGIDNITEEALNAYYGEEEGFKYIGKLYLNRAALLYNELQEDITGYKNSAIATSSWNVTEIWQGELTNLPKGGFMTKYSPIQTQVNIYKKTFVKKQLENWEFMGLESTVKDTDDIQDIFCIRISPTHYTSKILIKINCNIGIGGTESTFWGIRLWRRIGDDGAWEHLSDADGYLVTDTAGEPIGTPCWITNSSGGYSDASASEIANVSGSYCDSPNVGGESGAGVYVYYAAKWSALLGSDSEQGRTEIGGLLYINRPQVIDENNIYKNTPILSSSWNATEIWQDERTFIPGGVLISNNMSLQTLFNIYRDVVTKSGAGWSFIDNRIQIVRNRIQGFCIRIKLTHSTSKVILNLSCHIGIDYGTNARWWGLRLYRKIGNNGEWTHISKADGNNLTDNKGTSCWISHNLGADSSTSSYFVANVSGSYCDSPGTSTNYVYYTVKWCTLLGDTMSDCKLYLNRPAYYNTNNNNNSAVLSSSWCIQEIWQLGTPYYPKAVDDTFFKTYDNDTVGVGVGGADGIYKLDVNGSVHAKKYYSTGIDPEQDTNIVHNIISNSLDKINSINPISYIEDDGSTNYTFEVNNLHEKLPKLVSYTQSQPRKVTIEYMLLIPLLARSIQELSNKIDEQRVEINAMKLQLGEDQLGSLKLTPKTN